MERSEGARVTVIQAEQELAYVENVIVEELLGGPLTEDELVDRVSRRVNVYKQVVRYALLALDSTEDAEGHLVLPHKA